jgi:hypothetical protein
MRDDPALHGIRYAATDLFENVEMVLDILERAIVRKTVQKLSDFFFDTDHTTSGSYPIRLIACLKSNTATARTLPMAGDRCQRTPQADSATAAPPVANDQIEELTAPR